MRAAVVGGGLAGISAALGLADRGLEVTLLERSPQLGGLCRSVPDPVAGRVDTGQHAYLGCCTELEALLRRLRVRPALEQDRLDLTVVDVRSAVARRLAAWPLPPPTHLLPVLARWPGLPAGSIRRVARVASSLRVAADGLDSVPARGWLRSLGQPEDLIAQLWEPFLVSACNVSLDRCSAALAGFVIRQGLLASAPAGALRVPGTDLTRWLDPPADAALAAAGVEVRRESRVTALSRAGGPGLQVEDANGRQETFELLVLAVPAPSALRLLKGLGGDRPELVAAAALPSSPIVNVHLFTDRPFLPGPVVVVPRSPLQWVFDRSALDPDHRHDSWHSAISLSAADREVGVPERELATTMWELCRTTFPAAARAKLRHVRVTREAHATFAALPGSAGARPGPRSVVPGVALAGSWTDTGWPATMEGAVRSGRRAAATLTE